mgnify:CR=1 FL=1
MPADADNTAQNTPNLGGRPRAYDPSFAVEAQALCERGATDRELAEHFDVDTRTIYRWRNAFPEFCQAVVIGKDAADDRVERALYNRAVGYSFDSEKVFQAGGEIIRAPIVEHVPPDQGAALNWLKNRRGDKWRDKQEIDVNATGALADIIAGRRAKVADMNGKTDGE